MRGRLLEAKLGDKLESYLRGHLLGKIFCTKGRPSVRVIGWNPTMAQVEVAEIVIDAAVERGDIRPLTQPCWLGKDAMQLDVGAFGQFTLCQIGRLYSQWVDWNGEGTDWTRYNRGMDWVTLCRWL